jgi:hypothetical protein
LFGIFIGQSRSIAQKQDLKHPPAHRDKTAMNGAQLFKIQSDSLELMNGPPA